MPRDEELAEETQMTLSAEERQEIADAFRASMPAVEEMFHLYAREAGAPERFSLAVFDASDAGAGYEAGGDPEARTIAEHTIRTAEWVNDHIATGRRKVRAALRTQRDSGDLVRNAKELFQEGDQTSPGACLGDVNGRPICVATSGLRGTEDEPFSLLVIELLKRRLNPPT